MRSEAQASPGGLGMYPPQRGCVPAPSEVTPGADSPAGAVTTGGSLVLPGSERRLFLNQVIPTARAVVLE